MYEVLIAHLRECAKLDPSNNTYAEAADAIEELQADKAALNGTVTNLLEQIKDLGKPHWIPVTERLPEEYTTILFVSSSGQVHVGYYDSEHKWFCDMTGFRYVCTHWMLAPQPPKE